jgi:hypothetical protein
VPCARPHDGRLPHATLARILAGVDKLLNDPQLGLKAGQNVQRGDMDVLEYAGGSCLTLRGALECFIRYKALLHEGAELSLFEDGDVAMWRYRVTDGIEAPPAEHDFVVACVNAFVQSHTGLESPALAMHFAHDDPTNLEEYRRLFGCPIVLGAPYTGAVFPAERLNWPLREANPALKTVFEAQVHEKFSALRRGQPVSTLTPNTVPVIDGTLIRRCSAKTRPLER